MLRSELLVEIETLIQTYREGRNNMNVMTQISFVEGDDSRESYYLNTEEAHVGQPSFTRDEWL